MKLTQMKTFNKSARENRAYFGQQKLQTGLTEKNFFQYFTQPTPCPQAIDASFSVPQGSANLFCKAPDSKYLNIPSHVISVTAPQLCYGTVKAASDTMYMKKCVSVSI